MCPVLCNRITITINIYRAYFCPCQSFVRAMDGNITSNEYEINTSSFTKMHLKMAFAQWGPFCLGFNVLIKYKAVWIQLPPYPRRHYRTYFCEWKCSSFDSNFSEVPGDACRAYLFSTRRVIFYPESMLFFCFDTLLSITAMKGCRDNKHYSTTFQTNLI